MFDPDRSDRRALARSQPLDLVVRLTGMLREAGIDYCHWKSNAAIERSLTGDNDLDLLVARRDAGRFLSILSELFFKLAQPPAEKQLPGILDYYGLDEPSARIVHVHAHFQLVLGDDMTKNFRLPIEDAYLRSCSREELLPIPAAEFEYLVFVPRMVVKHCPWDALLARKGRLTQSERRELSYLEQRIDPRRVERLREQYLPFIDEELWALCRRAIAHSAGPMIRAEAGHHLVRALNGHARSRAAADLRLKTWRRMRSRARRMLPGSPIRKRPATGGLVIGVVGGDGSGKSSTVEALGDFLSHDFTTRLFHLGKPPPSLMTKTVKRPIQKLRNRGAFLATRLPPWADLEETGFPGVVFLLWHVLTARDRYLAYRRLRRAAGRGAVVVCDRYPLSGVHLMDGPRTTRVPGLASRPLARRLIHREAAYYERILPPDLLIVLRVDPEVAVERRHDEDVDFVRRRAQEVWDNDWSSQNTVVIDASKPLQEVLGEVRAVVWAFL